MTELCPFVHSEPACTLTATNHNKPHLHTPLRKKYKKNPQPQTLPSLFHSQSLRKPFLRHRFNTGPPGHACEPLLLLSGSPGPEVAFAGHMGMRKPLRQRLVASRGAFLCQVPGSYWFYTWGIPAIHQPTNLKAIARVVHSLNLAITMIDPVYRSQLTRPS